MKMLSALSHQLSASRLRKNCFSRQRFTSAAKAASEYAALTARLEAAPFQNSGEIRVFPQPAKPFGGFIQ
jgi:hypothetical protein